MFSRVSVVSRACFRCQILSAARRLGRHVEITTGGQSNVRGLQNAAALDAYVNGDDESSRPTNGQDEREQKTLNHAEQRRANTSMPQTRLPSTTRFRRWRPHQAEDIGVDVLGEPAKVLILPTPGPKPVRPAQIEHTPHETNGIRESLELESKSVSMAEVLRNIDGLREELGKGKIVFSETDWADHERQLARGFTKLQLREYLRVAAEKSKDESKVGSSMLDNQKRTMAATIMKEVWHWARSSSAEEDDYGTTPNLAPAAVKELVTKNVVVSTGKIDYVMLHAKQQLGHVSETFGVQIDVFKKRNRIRLKGSSDAVSNAKSALDRLLKDVDQLSMLIPRDVRDLFRDQAEWEGLLPGLMQKHKVLIQREKNDLTVVKPAAWNADIILRDLVFLSGRFRRTTSFTLCLGSGQESTTEAPVYPESLPEWLQHKRVWYRHMSSQTDSENDEALAKLSARTIRKVAGNVLKSEKPDQRRLSRFAIAPSSLSHEYRADLGQALFSNIDSFNTTDDPSTTRSCTTESVFTLRQALLPQVLARKDFTSVDQRGFSGRRSDEEDGDPFRLHLRLHPISSVTESPTIEILLSGRDRRLGLRQQLKIDQVFAVLDEWQHLLLLPQRSLDILMSRQSKVDLLVHSDTTRPQPYLDLLSQLASHLEKAQLSSSETLSPLWELDILSLMSSRQSRQSGNTSNYPFSDDKTSPDGQPSSNNVSPNVATTMYVMEPPEYLDIASYTSPLTSDRFIDHILCDTDGNDRPRQRQILRVTANSLSNRSNRSSREPRQKAPSAPGNTIEQQRWFKQSVTAAYDLATMFANAEKLASKSNR